MPFIFDLKFVFVKQLLTNLSYNSNLSHLCEEFWFLYYLLTYTYVEFLL